MGDWSRVAVGRRSSGEVVVLMSGFWGPLLGLKIRLIGVASLGDDGGG